MNFKFLSKPKLSAIPKCNVGFWFSAEPFSTATGNEFWGQNSTPVEADSTGNLGEQGVSELGNLHCSSEGFGHQNLS